jgi:hypothetical protein
VDLLAAVGNLKAGAITAGAINYLVCRRVPGVAAAKIPREMEKAGVGDPLGEKALKERGAKRKG